MKLGGLYGAMSDRNSSRAGAEGIFGFKLPELALSAAANRSPDECAFGPRAPDASDGIATDSRLCLLKRLSQETLHSGRPISRG